MSNTKPVVLITGALTGIGRAAAEAFARSGAKLVVSGRREAEGKALVEQLKAAGGEAIFVLTDVRDEAQVKALVDTAVKTYGRLDVAVNNAGTEGEPGPLAQVSVDSYQSTFDTNVKGTLLALKYELPVMVAQGSGSIINLSSIAGHVGMAGAGVYVASKHAVEGLTRVAALEGAAAGVRVNAVAPGPIQTDMFERFTGRNDDNKAGLIGMMPAKRIGTVEEVAAAILYLASPAAGYVNGTILPIDGGYSAQ